MGSKFKIKVVPDVSQEKSCDQAFSFYDDKVFLVNSQYKKFFGNLFRDDNNLPWKRGIVKVTFCKDKKKHTIHRLFHSGNSRGISHEEVGLSKMSLGVLQITNYNEQDNLIELKISKGNRFMFYWNHSEHIFRSAFKLALVFGLITVISLIVSVVSLIKS